VSDWFEVNIDDLSPDARQALGNIYHLGGVDRGERSDERLVLQTLLENVDAAKIGRMIAGKDLASCDHENCDCEARLKAGLFCRENDYGKPF
jgi:hypothetical protein